MASWQEVHQNKLISLEEAVQKLRPKCKVWVGGISSNPVLFLKTLDKHLTEFEGCELYSGLMTSPYEFLKPQYRKNFHHYSLFMGPVERATQNGGNVEVINFQFSNFDKVIDTIQPNTIVIEATPPNADGYMSMGSCGGVANKSVMKYADQVIFVINDAQPFISNEENLVHIDDVDFITEGHHPIAAPKAGEPNELEKQIASHVIPFVPNNSTVQIGIGSLPNAVGMGLRNHTGLGIHTEMFTECLMELCKAGAVTGEHKTYKPNKLVAAFAAGPQELLDFLANNPDFEMGNMAEVVDCRTVEKHDNFISINTCVMVDLVGQVASEGVGFSQISGSGGQLDFVRGAGMSKNGVSVLALAATRKGKDGLESNIRLSLPVGTPVTTPRNDTQVIATEFGSADLRGLSTSDRAKALISIAHPDFRESLMAEAVQNGIVR
jgi:acyl-CoA hydrolase